MPEFFDVVNENDEVIDRLPRAIVHERDLLHRAVHAMVFNRFNEIYLQKRSLNKDVNPGLWDTSVGGHLEVGESYDAAIIRETREELTIDLKQAPKRLFKLAASKQTGHEFIWVYRVDYNGEVKPCKKEISEGRWVNSSDLKKWIKENPQDFTETFRLILRSYKQFI